jgi:hypothetical protein
MNVTCVQFYSKSSCNSVVCACSQDFGKHDLPALLLAKTASFSERIILITCSVARVLLHEHSYHSPEAGFTPQVAAE